MINRQCWVVLLIMRTPGNITSKLSRDFIRHFPLFSFRFSHIYLVLLLPSQTSSNLFDKNILFSQHSMFETLNTHHQETRPLIGPQIMIRI